MWIKQDLKDSIIILLCLNQILNDFKLEHSSLVIHINAERCIL